MKLEENRAPDPKEESMAGDRREIMEIAMRAGHILLKNGAEISRVEERPLTGSAVITGSSQQIRLSSAMGSFLLGKPERRILCQGAAHSRQRRPPEPGGGRIARFPGDREENTHRGSGAVPGRH